VVGGGEGRASVVGWVPRRRSASSEGPDWRRAGPASWHRGATSAFRTATRPEGSFPMSMRTPSVSKKHETVPWVEHVGLIVLDPPGGTANSSFTPRDSLQKRGQAVKELDEWDDRT
jgi:hypothetical protein